MPKGQGKSFQVEYVKQAVPAFLQRFKQETGYQEHTVEDKLKELQSDVSYICYAL